MELQDAAQPEDHAAPQKASEAEAKVSNAGVKTKPVQPAVSKEASAAEAKVIKAVFKAEAKASIAGVKTKPAQPAVSKGASAGKAKVIKAVKAVAKVSKAGMKSGPETSKTTAPALSSVNKVSLLVNGTF